MTANKSKYGMLLLVAGLVAGLDQLTKYLICEWVPLYSRVEVIKGFFNIIHIRNSGVAFGLFKRFGNDYRFFSMAVVLLIIVFLIFFLVSQVRKGLQLQAFSLAVILGGAVGNLIDRFYLGEVIDFLDLHWGNVYHWPAFNLADSAITVGIVLILFDELVLSRKRERDSAESKAHSA